MFFVLGIEDGDGCAARAVVVTVFLRTDDEQMAFVIDEHAGETAAVDRHRSNARFEVIEIDLDGLRLVLLIFLFVLVGIVALVAVIVHNLVADFLVLV
ncbi:MAG: hypothetical protein AB7N71_11250, partial [Phycisphaerae bacterium]